MMDDVSIHEIRRIRMLATELLEALTLTVKTVIDYSHKHNIPLPDNLSPLLGHAISILRELDSKSLKLPELNHLSDDFLQTPNPTQTLQNPKICSKCNEQFEKILDKIKKLFE